MPETDAAQRFRDCCGSEPWVERMLARRPFGDADTLLRAADAFGAAVALSKGCADPTSPKALLRMSHGR